MTQDADPLISISAAAKKIGVNKSTLSRQIADGSVRSHEGKVRLSEVLEDRANNIDLTRSSRRAGKIDGDADASLMQRPGAPDATAPVAATDGDNKADPVLVDGQALPYSEARALKETYLARLRKHEYEIAMGEWVRVEAVGRIVEQEYGVLRQAVLGMSSKLADRLVGRDRTAMKLVIDQAADELLAHLSDPAGMAGKAA